MTEKTKHSFVDDNPYLVYTGEPDTAIEGGSGSGSGDGGGSGAGGILYVTITGEKVMENWSDDQANPETLSSDKSSTEILQAIADGKTVIAKTRMYDMEEIENFTFLPLVYYGDGVITFNAVVLLSDKYLSYLVNFNLNEVSGYVVNHSFS